MYRSLFKGQETRIIYKFWSIFMLPEPDLGLANECGSMWIRNLNIDLRYLNVEVEASGYGIYVPAKSLAGL
jgi:hypothetical protein